MNDKTVGARTKTQWIRLTVIALVLWGSAYCTRIYLLHVLHQVRAHRIAERQKRSSP